MTVIGPGQAAGVVVCATVWTQCRGGLQGNRGLHMEEGVLSGISVMRLLLGLGSSLYFSLLL